MTQDEFNKQLHDKINAPVIRPSSITNVSQDLENKYKKVIDNIGDIIEPIKEQSPKIWWQVYTKEKTFGFATIDNKIVDFPERQMIGNTLQNSRWWFMGKKAEVVKICEQKL